MSDLPTPFTPPDCDLRGYEYMPLFGQRLFGSVLFTESTDQEFRVAIKLWWEAWSQCPAGSLPNSDKALARFADFGTDIKGWMKVKAMALRGFVLCDDGRLYHPMLCDAAVKAYALRIKNDAKRETDRERLRAWRELRKQQASSNAGSGGGNDSGNVPETPSETPDETRFETPVVAGGREGKVKEGSKKEPPTLRVVPPETRGSRLSADWVPSEAEHDFALSLGLNPDAVAAKFRDFWIGKPGANGRKLDWFATWRNWCRDDASKRKPAPQDPIAKLFDVMGLSPTGQPTDVFEPKTFEPKRILHS